MRIKQVKRHKNLMEMYDTARFVTDQDGNEFTVKPSFKDTNKVILKNKDKSIEIDKKELDNYTVMDGNRKTITENIESAQNVALFMSTPIEELNFNTVKLAVNDFFNDYNKLPQGMDALDPQYYDQEGEFYGKYYEFAKKCNDVSKSQFVNVSGYGSDDATKLKIKDLCSSVDYRFPYGWKNHYKATEQNITESLGNSLRDVNIKTLEYLIEFDYAFPFPDNFSGSGWQEWLEWLTHGLEDDIEIAENLIQYLKKDVDFSNKHKDVYEDDPQSELTISIYNKLKTALQKELAKYNDLDESGKLTGYKLSITKNGETFDDYAYAYEDEGAIKQMHNKYGDNIEVNIVRRAIKEAYEGKYSDKFRSLIKKYFFENNVEAMNAVIKDIIRYTPEEDLKDLWFDRGYARDFDKDELTEDSRVSTGDTVKRWEIDYFIDENDDSDTPLTTYVYTDSKQEAINKVKAEYPNAQIVYCVSENVPAQYKKWDMGESLDGFVQTQCDSCGKTNKVKVNFPSHNKGFDTIIYKCKYCNTENELTDSHEYNDDGTLKEDVSTEEPTDLKFVDNRKKSIISGNPWDDPGFDEYDIDESLPTDNFKVGDRVKQAHTSTYNVGTVTKTLNTNGLQYEVKWDYSDGDDIEILDPQDIAPYNEEDEKLGLYESTAVSNKYDLNATVRYLDTEIPEISEELLNLLINMRSEDITKAANACRNFYAIAEMLCSKYNSAVPQRHKDERALESKKCKARKDNALLEAIDEEDILHRINQFQGTITVSEEDEKPLRKILDSKGVAYIIDDSTTGKLRFKLRYKSLKEKLNSNKGIKQITEDIYEPLEGPSEGAEFGLASSINVSIQKELETINEYDSLAINARAEGYDDIAKVIDHITTEEYEHITELQEVLKTLAPNAKAMDDADHEDIEEGLDDSRDFKTWQDVYKHFKSLEASLNDAEAVTALVDEEYRTNKGNEIYEIAYKKWCDGE